MANPSHLPVVFTRSTHVRKEHIAGEKASQGKTDIMTVVPKGESRKIVYSVAMDLIVGQTCLIENRQNEEAIEEIRAQVKAETERLKKKAA